ncbi:MAG: hypothetical protein E7412_03470 [Ruminococcaceae bacterium]|nr:hypothetical protein [Oscillospiraceae bacterium]
MIGKNLKKRLLSVGIATVLLSGVFPQVSFAAADDANTEADFKETDRVVHYARSTGLGRNQAWDKNMPYPLESVPSNVGVVINTVNDGSHEHPAESHFTLNKISGGNVVVMYDFALDRRMDDTAFRLLGSKKPIFGIVTKGRGIYLEQPGGKNIFLTSYTPGSSGIRETYVVRAFLDFDAKQIERVQINGKTYAVNKPFSSDATVADAFAIRTSEEAVGVVSNRCLYIDGGYILDEVFLSGAGVVPDDWGITSSGGVASLSEANSAYPERFYLTFDSQNGPVTAERKVKRTSGALTFELNTLVDEKRGDFDFSLMDGDKTLIKLSSDGKSFCYIDENGNAIPFYEFVKNIWYNLKVKLDTKTDTYDLYMNNRIMLKGLKFANAGDAVDAVKIYSGKSNELLHVDDVLLSKTEVYAEDYPVIREIPEKKEGAPLVGVQFCPMWVEGTHFGWDWIAQSSDRREPVIGFYDGNKPEAADWIIKQMVEHGADYMSICTFPHINNNNGSDIISQIKDNDPRSAGFLSAVLDSRYSDKIKYSLFLEANGIKAGQAYYDDFFEVVWPHYIEHYFKDPRYLKVDGRPVFGIYAADNIFNVFNDGSGKASIQKGVEKMRQMCIDAGVGNPYLIVNNGNYAIDATVNAGFDAVSSYGLGYNATFTYQKTYFESSLEACKAKGVDFIASPVPMRDDSGWRPEGGYWHTEEEFDQFLNWVNDDLLKDYKPSVSQKLLNVCTWDEYGEGHIVAPTVGLGFQYMDAVRSSLTNGGEHIDDIPTDAQKERINKLYTGDRKIQNVIYETANIDRKIFYEAREKSPAEKIPEKVKKGWYMTNSADSSRVTAVSQVATISSTPEGLAVYPSDTTPRIGFDISDGIDAYDVTYVKIRMKKNPTSGGGFMYWSGDMVSMDNDKKLFFNAGINDGKEFVDYYVPVSSNMNWTGSIERVEFMLGQISDTSQPFIIESIEFLQDEEITAMDKVIIDERIQSLNDPYIEQDGTVMIPMRAVMYMAGADEILAYQSEGTYTIKVGEDVSFLTEGSRKALVKGQDVMIPVAPFRKSEIINDTVYIPLELAEAIMTNKEFSWDSELRTLTIKSLEDEEEDIGREVIFSIDYDDETSMTNPNGLTGISFKDGKMTATTSNNDPNFALHVNLDASAIKFVNIKVNTPSPVQFKFYFIKNTDTRWGETKGTAIVTTKAGNNSLMFDTSMIGTWSDTITVFRIDPATATGATFTMDQVVFYGDEVATAAQSGEDMSSCVTVSDKAYEWKFNKNTRFDGWEFSKAWGNVEAKDGRLGAVITGFNPTFANIRNIDVDTQSIGKIVLKYANKTNSRKLKVYFLTDKDKDISESKCFVLDVVPMSESSNEYVIETNGNENWSGVLKKLVIVPEAGAMGSISVDNISLMMN